MTSLDVPLAGKALPAATGPMSGPWDPVLLYDLQGLKMLLCRAQDAVQVGGPVDPAFPAAMRALLDHPRFGGPS